MTSHDTRNPWQTLAVGLSRVLGALLAFPAFKLVWPWPRDASLRGDLYPELTGAAIATLATLPIFAVLYSLRRAPRPACALLFVGFAAAALTSAALQPPVDTLEFDRWRLLAATCFALLIGGAALDDLGRRWLARASVVVAFVALVLALLDAEHQYTGVLGNTGSISEAALLGAAVGLSLAVTERGIWRWIGGLCATTFAFYVGVAPVFAGALALVAALLVALIFGRSSRPLLASAALFTVIAFGAGRVTPHGPSAPAAVGAPIAGAENTGGIEVRERIWSRVPQMLADWGLLGVGPGQFAAAFPPYRDPAEIELSSHGRTLPGQETEVQHAHSDLLQGFSDGGPIGGLFFLAFLIAAGWRALRALREGEPTRAALGVGVLALLANALAREPLLNNPVSASLGFAAIGALFSPTTITPVAGAAARGPGRYAVLAVASLAIVLQVPRAIGLGLHGRALREFFEHGGEQARLDFVLDTRPDSVMGRTIQARRIEEREAAHPGTATFEAWRAVLALRPHSFEALMQLGLAAARAERVDEARSVWTRALALDPLHPGLRRNLARLEARSGDLERSRELLAGLGVPARRAFADYAVGALRDLDIERGWRLFEEIDERLIGLNAELAHHFARDDRGALSEVESTALEGSAHVVWAREHGERGDGAAAVRSYRQARRCLAPVDENGVVNASRALRLEGAAALALDGKRDEARTELGDVVATPLELTRLPTWAGQALLEAGLLVR